MPALNSNQIKSISWTAKLKQYSAFECSEFTEEMTLVLPPSYHQSLHHNWLPTTYKTTIIKALQSNLSINSQQHINYIYNSWYNSSHTNWSCSNHQSLSLQCHLSKHFEDQPITLMFSSVNHQSDAWLLKIFACGTPVHSCRNVFPDGHWFSARIGPKLASPCRIRARSGPGQAQSRLPSRWSDAVLMTHAASASTEGPTSSTKNRRRTRRWT